MASNIAVENAIAKLNNSTMRQNKIMIGLTVASLMVMVLSIAVAIFFGLQKKEAEGKMGQIGQEAKILINNNYFNGAPKEVRDAVITISTLSSDSAVLQR
jgi:hypothetical protein